MANTAHFIGIDIGAHHLALGLIDQAGQSLANNQRAIGNSSEQDPQDWWRAVRTGVKDLLRRAKVPSGSIRGIGISGPADAMVFLDEEGNVLCPSVNGHDSRFDPYAAKLGEKLGVRNCYNITSRPIKANCMASQILWMQEHEPRVWHDTAHILSARDFLRFRMCGNFITDPSTAVRSLLFNHRQAMWSKQLSQRLDFDLSLLPEVHPGIRISGMVNQQAATETGLEVGTPIVTGGNHISTVAVALGAIKPNQAVIELGGSGGLFCTSEKALRDPEHLVEAANHCLSDMWALEARNVVGDQSINWLLREVTTSERNRSRRSKVNPLEILAEIASEIPPGSEGLVYVPPEINGGQGSFAGLNHHHGHGHLVRSVLEGGALHLLRILKRIEELGLDVEDVCLSGPGASNNLWCQIITDALGVTTRSVDDEQPSILGSAILASVACGFYKDISKASKAMGPKSKSYKPRKAARECYLELEPKAAQIASTIRETLSIIP